MKMVKSLLLVSAAGVVAASGAQAADLPVKAKPVEYVKVCSLYGAGFYYVPGTDICMKIGGYVRYQVSAGEGNSISFGPFDRSSGFNTRSTYNSDYAQRVRVNFTYDTRQQTAYGTLRTYLLLGWTHDTPSTAIGPAPGVYFNRGFIQIAGFTFGKSTSFFDFGSTAAVAYNAGFLNTSDTGDTGQVGAAYTAQFGNGFSGTISVEQSRRSSTVFTVPGGSLASVGSGGTGTGWASGMGGPVQDNLGGATASRPDIVANLRIDQAWGSAQLSGALHEVSAAYYGGAGAPEINGHPSDEWGWAIMGGIRLNAPMIGPGDYFQAQVGYSDGATRYTAWNVGGNGTYDYYSGNTFGFGFGTDAVFAGNSACTGAATTFGCSIQKTTGFSVFASYEHFWTPSLRTSIYGSYVDVSHNSNAKGMICQSWIGTAATVAGVQCDPDFQAWAIGTRSQWNITNAFYVGVDVIYNKLQTATINNGNPIFLAGGTFLPVNKTATFYQTQDQDQVAVTWRIHRDIVP